MQIIRTAHLLPQRRSRLFCACRHRHCTSSISFISSWHRPANTIRNLWPWCRNVIIIQQDRHVFCPDQPFCSHVQPVMPAPPGCQRSHPPPADLHPHAARALDYPAWCQRVRLPVAADVRIKQVIAARVDHRRVSYNCMRLQHMRVVPNYSIYPQRCQEALNLEFVCLFVCFGRCHGVSVPVL